MDFHVGPWLIRPAMNRLDRGSRSFRVTPKAMEVLVCLASRQGSVVSKDELFRSVWPGIHVTDDALTRCIGELRHAFGTRQREPAVIETIPKRGYRIAAPVEWDLSKTATSGEPGVTTGLGAPDAMQPQVDRRSGAAPMDIATRAPAPSRWKRPGALAAVVASLVLTLAVLVALNGDKVRTALGIRSVSPAIHSIAVLPLTDLSGNLEQDYFAEGMTEALITELAQMEGCKVLSRTSVMQYKTTKKRLPEIARELGVDAVIEGTVMRSDSQMRITAQLIHAATDTHLWSRSFEQKVGDVLALQRTVAREVATELGVKLRSEEPVRAGRTRRVAPEAYEEYLKGRYFILRGQFSEAVSHFERAIANDSSFALAHTQLYEAHAQQAFRDDLPVPARAIWATEAARKLDDRLAEVFTNAGDVKFYWDWNWKEGEAAFRRAVELDPGSVTALNHYVTCLHVLARWDTALQACQRTLEVDPVSPFQNVQFLTLLTDAQRYERANQQYQKATELHPNNGSIHAAAGVLYQAQGREDEAVAAYLKGDSLGGWPAQFNALQNAARTGGIHGYWHKRLDLLREKAQHGRVPPFDFASVYIQMGEKDKAIEMLEAAYEQRAPRLVWIRARAIWRPLHSDPRFQSLLRRMRFPE